MSDDPYISIHYADHETGWAEDLGNGTYRLANIPLEDGLNIDDIVTLKPGDPECCSRPIVDQILSKAYLNKIVISYNPSTQENYNALSAEVTRAGGKCEGLMEGLAGVAVKDVKQLVKHLQKLTFETALIPGDAPA